MLRRLMQWTFKSKGSAKVNAKADAKVNAKATGKESRVLTEKELQQWQEAKKLRRRGKYQEGHELLKHLAGKGNASALIEMGTIYRDGSEGVQRDFKTAISHYLQARKNEDLRASYLLADMCKESTDTEMKKLRLSLTQEAAAGGIAEAQTQLADRYLTGGDNVEKSLFMASEYYLMAHKQSYYLATLKLGQLKCTRKHGMYDPQEARELLTRVIDESPSLGEEAQRSFEQLKK